MALIKICPACQAKNPASLLECDQCGTDLMGVRPCQDGDEAPAAQPARPTPAAARVCSECGAANPPASRRCQQCGEDISDIPPTPLAPAPAEEAPLDKKPLCLVSLDGSFRLPLAQDAEEIVLGREGALQAHLSERMYVARCQARIVPGADGCLLENLSRTNPTFVNNEPLSPGEKRPLHAGDEIGLGGRVIEGERQAQAAYLLVREDA